MQRYKILFDICFVLLIVVSVLLNYVKNHAIFFILLLVELIIIVFGLYCLKKLKNEH